MINGLIKIRIMGLTPEGVIEYYCARMGAANTGWIGVLRKAILSGEMEQAYVRSTTG
jgi:hypothetical protein